LKEKAPARTRWRSHSGRSYGPVLRWTTQLQYFQDSPLLQHTLKQFTPAYKLLLCFTKIRCRSKTSPISRPSIPFLAFTTYD